MSAKNALLIMFVLSVHAEIAAFAQDPPCPKRGLQLFHDDGLTDRVGEDSFGYAPEYVINGKPVGVSLSYSLQFPLRKSKERWINLSVARRGGGEFSRNLLRHPIDLQTQPGDILPIHGQLFLCIHHGAGMDVYCVTDQVTKERRPTYGKHAIVADRSFGVARETHVRIDPKDSTVAFLIGKIRGQVPEVKVKAGDVFRDSDLKANYRVHRIVAPVLDEVRVRDTNDMGWIGHIAGWIELDPEPIAE